MTDTTKKLTAEERTAKMRAGRDKAGAAVRVARNDVLINQEEYIGSSEFKAKHKGNTLAARMYADLWANREKYKVNPDGTKMTTDDAIKHREAREAELTDTQRKHLGLPTKKELKEAAEAAVTEEVEDEESEAA